MRLIIELETGDRVEATEFRSGNASVGKVIQADPEYGVTADDVGKWRILSPRTSTLYSDPMVAIQAALNLERLEDEGRA